MPHGLDRRPSSNFNSAIFDRGAYRLTEKVELELKDLQATLKNIETARPFDELTVVRVMFFSVDVEKEEEEARAP